MSLIDSLNELDESSYPEFREGILRAEMTNLALPGKPRSYPGYPCWALERVRPRWGPALEKVLEHRRSHRLLDTTLPCRKTMSRLLKWSHGISSSYAAGPVPSAGGLQALELYLITFEESWLPSGSYHYDRQAHHLSQLSRRADREEWGKLVPSMMLVQGGALLWVLVGDGNRVSQKYGGRSWKFLIQESGHCMQNLCLLSESFQLATVPLGGYFEQQIARELKLPEHDSVLYVGICGSPVK